MYSYVIFDLDGTLLNTIDDLADTGNHVCANSTAGPPTRWRSISTWWANGIPKLVERFAPAGTDQPTLDQAFGGVHGLVRRPQGGQDRPIPRHEGGRPAAEGGGGCPSRCCPTRPTSMARAGGGALLPRGVSPGAGGPLRRPPPSRTPTLLYKLMERMGAKPEQTLFVGDSNVDIRIGQERKSDQLRRAVGLPLPAGAGGPRGPAIWPRPRRS